MSMLTHAEDTVLRLDPRTKLLLVVCTNVVMLSGGFSGISALVRPLFAALPFVLLAAEKRWRAAGTYLAFVAVSVLSELFLVRMTSGIVNLLLVIFCGVISRFVPGLVMGGYLVGTTKISELVAALERMRVPQRIIIPFAVMVRFFPTVMEENAAISTAMRMRGIRFGGGNAAAMLEYRLVPLLMNTVRIGEELSASALTRGLGAPVRRTNICSIGFRPVDIAAILVSAAAFTAYLLF